MPKKIEMIGLRFNRLLVESEAGVGSKGYEYLCLCDCGNRKVISGSLIRRNKVQSCGCLRSETTAAKNTTHGSVGTPEYESWQGMKSRCTNKNQSSFVNYGGRGISYCKEWESFEKFLEDMGPRPEGKTLDRIDNSLGYSKENCRWATVLEQAGNTRQVVKLTLNGVTMTMTEWAKATGIPYPTIQDRRRRCLSVEAILRK